MQLQERKSSVYLKGEEKGQLKLMAEWTTVTQNLGIKYNLESCFLKEGSLFTWHALAVTSGGVSEVKAGLSAAPTWQEMICSFKHQ